jgi:phosphatidylinositol-3,4,5-trisphosphate 3-phosphatase/dual-specificity protein phosphatase PTEN
MGWFWFIPAFHLSQSESTTTLRLVRKEVDFPLGPGEWIVDVEIGMEWVAESAPGMPTGMGAVGSRVGEGEAEAEEKTPIREKERKVEVAKQKSAESDFV